MRIGLIGLLCIWSTISTSPVLGSAQESKGEVSFDELLVCPEESTGCAKQTCTTLCAEQGEDPLECSWICNWEA